MANLELKSTIAKIPADRAKDIVVENVLYILHKDTHVEIHWGYKGVGVGYELLVPADTYNAFLEDNERFEPVHDLGAYWCNSDFSERCEDAAEYMRVNCVLHPEILEGVIENILDICKTFPNGNTYPAPVHEGHAAIFYATPKDL